MDVGVADVQVHLREGQHTEESAEQKQCDGEAADDDRLLGVELFLEGKAENHRDEQHREEK